MSSEQPGLEPSLAMPPAPPAPRYSVVIPVYGNEDTLARLIDQMKELAGRLDAPLEVVFVIDGSPDGSLILLRRLLAEVREFSSQLTALSRNFGAFSAVRVGLAAADGEYIAVISADLQEPPSLLEDFFAALESGEHDVAIGIRASRQDPRMGQTFSRWYWGLYRRLVQREMPRSGVDCFACSRQVATQLIRLEESHTSLVGLLLWLGYRRAEVPYERLPRPTGRSSWSFRRRARYLLDSVFSFTDLPVLLMTIVGFVGIVVSTGLGLTVLIASIAGEIDVAGYTPLMLAIVFIGSSILLGLGIIGGYVWRTYENTKRRPGAIPMSHERFGPPEA
jgi:polyisoprenyl-phosphate glycosyltransferase